MRRRLAVVLFALGCASAGAAAAHDVEARPASVRDGFRLAVAGDMIGPYAAFLDRDDPALMAALRPLEEADVAFANVEGGIFDLATFAGYPAAENGGGTPLGDAAVAFDLKRIGLTLLSRANNHATDWGAEGLMSTSRSIQAAGLAQAGAGPDLTAARSPAYVDTPGGRVALVATASSFTAMSPAADGRGNRRARPGISPLNVRALLRVTVEEMQGLAAIAARRDGRPAPAEPPREISFGRQGFRLAEGRGLTYDVDAGDREAVLQSVRCADAEADLVVFSIHAHQGEGFTPDDTASLHEDEDAHGGQEGPGDFLRPLFHDAIDAGADIVVRHGPHALEGIEIYRGKPIFYGMASLFFDVGDADRRFGRPGREWRFPPEWDESAIAVTAFDHGRVSEIRIYPMVMRYDAPDRMGLPRPANAQEATRILARVRRQSLPYGVEVMIENDVGVVRPAT